MLSSAQQLKAASHYVLSHLHESGETCASAEGQAFAARFEAHFPRLFEQFASLYGQRDDCLDQLAALVGLAARSWRERPAELKKLDRTREADPDWYQSNRMLGGVCYVDRYARDLNGLRQHLPYLRELGLTYLHLMPVFDCPEGRSDGGYAVSSYRDIRADLGTMADLRALAADLRDSGISLVLDFIFNHTSSEHSWAKAAVAGDPAHDGFYWIFPDRTLPDAYERTLREIFPDDHPGAFVQLPDGRWIWSTFHSFQWDLNYSNPAVFRAMAGEMLFLANQGVEILRMDAVAFIWKRLGTPCESLPEAHTLIRAFNTVCRMAAPSLLFKSEAIVHPDEVVSYIDERECQLSYNPLLMALGWEALATREVGLLDLAIHRRQPIDATCAWINYVRSHDDIGWTFADEEAAELGIVGYDHRLFLNAFYTNRHPGSFARGIPFQFNPRTGDCRIAGTTASLAGLEAEDDGAIDRILLLHGLAMSAGGIPLIYLGDEVGQLNDYAYASHEENRSDARWAHRPHRPDLLYQQRDDPCKVAGKIYGRLTRMIAARKHAPELAGGRIKAFTTENPHVLGFIRWSEEQRMYVFANFADDPQHLEAERFAAVPSRLTDVISGEAFHVRRGLTLAAHRIVWLR